MRVRHHELPGGEGASFEPRYVEKERAIKPGLIWIWLAKPIRVTAGSVVQLA